MKNERWKRIKLDTHFLFDDRRVAWANVQHDNGRQEGREGDDANSSWKNLHIAQFYLEAATMHR